MPVELFIGQKNILSVSITHLSTSVEKDHLFNDKIAYNKWVKYFLKALKKQEHSDPLRSQRLKENSLLWSQLPREGVREDLNQ